MTPRRPTITRSWASKPSRNVRLNATRLALLADVGELGLIDVDIAHQRHHPTATKEWTRQLLVLLANGGLLGRVAIRVLLEQPGGNSGGRPAAIYFLTEAGADIVAQCTGSYPKRPLRKSPSGFTIAHRLQIVKTRIAIEQAAAAAQLAPPQWIGESDLREGAAGDLSPHERRVLYHEFRTPRGKAVCRPDGAVLLRIPKPAGADFSPLGCLLEIDFATEGSAQCRAKLPGYAALLHERTFPYWSEFANLVVRVLWVVCSARRVSELARVYRDTEVAEFFRFTTFAHCGPGLLTDPVWQDVEGRTLAIYRRPPQSS